MGLWGALWEPVGPGSPAEPATVSCTDDNWVRGGLQSSWPSLSLLIVTPQLFFVPSSVAATIPSLIVKSKPFYSHRRPLTWQAAEGSKSAPVVAPEEA